MNEEITTDALAALLHAAKAEEAQAKERRTELEAMLFVRLEDQTEEGKAKTINLDEWKVVIARKVSRSIDQEQATTVYQNWPQGGRAFPCKTTWKEDKKMYNALPSAMQELFDGAITERPTKPSISVEALKSKPASEVFAEAVAAASGKQEQQPTMPGA